MARECEEVDASCAIEFAELQEIEDRQEQDRHAESRKQFKRWCNETESYEAEVAQKMANCPWRLPAVDDIGRTRFKQWYDQTPCHKFAMGQCKRGDNCKFYRRYMGP